MYSSCSCVSSHEFHTPESCAITPVLEDIFLIEEGKQFNLNLPAGSDIKWVQSDIQISVGGEVDIGATVNTSDKNITIELQKAVGNNIVLINGLKVLIQGVEPVALTMTNNANETIGRIQNIIKVGSISINTQKDTNIVWMTSMRSNLLPDIQIQTGR